MTNNMLLSTEFFNVLPLNYPPSMVMVGGEGIEPPPFAHVMQ